MLQTWAPTNEASTSAAIGPPPCPRPRGAALSSPPLQFSPAAPWSRALSGRPTFATLQEQSSLTGEPDAIAATVKAQHELPIEARNIVFSSSLVHNGAAATGRPSEPSHPLRPVPCLSPPPPDAPAPPALTSQPHHTLHNPAAAQARASAS